MADDRPLLLFEVYRWPGTTPEEFEDHYTNVHAKLAMKVPGVVWYETFFNRNPTRGWPVMGSDPQPDAHVLVMFDSQESLDNVPNLPEWDEATRDDNGFCSHFKSYPVERCTWIPCPAD